MTNYSSTSESDVSTSAIVFIIVAAIALAYLIASAVIGKGDLGEKL